MLSKSVQDALNNQVGLEAASSQAYLAMASWADIQPGLQGVTEFFYTQAEEERVHMLKLIKYVNERGGFAVVPALAQPIITFQSLKRVFEEFLRHELGVSESINDIVHLAFQEKDYATHNFLHLNLDKQCRFSSRQKELPRLHWINVRNFEKVTDYFQISCSL